jgi:hypothetical protein
VSRYPDCAYRQLFPAGEAFSPFDPAEDGDHYRPEPNFFEWWYFDVVLDDGSYLVAILHSSLYNAADHKPTVDLRYYPAKGDPVVAMGRFQRSEYGAAADRCRVRVGGCLAVDEGSCYRLSLCQEPIRAELAFWPRLPGWRVGTGHLFADETSGHHFDWVVPLPCARVEGTLTIAGRRRAVSGAGYHDHNWGNLYLSAAFSRWTWGRVLGREWTLIFGDLIGQGESSLHVTPFVLARGDEILFSTDRIRVQGTGTRQEPHTGVDYFRHLHLAVEEKPTVNVTLTARRTIEALDFAAPRPALARHRRLRGAAEAAFYLAQDRSILRRLVARPLGRGSYLRMESDCHLALSNRAVETKEQALQEVMVL